MKSLISSIALVLASISPHSTLLANTESPSNLDAKDWRYATDPYGSKAIYQSRLVNENGARIEFYRAPKVSDNQFTWIELIYDLPNGSLSEVEKVKLTYKSDRDLTIKLSQKDYGGDGDNSYAHYQKTVAAQEQWSTITFDFTQFKRPEWTPSTSKDKGIIKENVNALYFAPKVSDNNGGQALLEIQHIELLSK